MNLNEKKHRFILDEVVEVIPFNIPKLKLKYEQESGQLFWRKKLNGKLVFKKGCCRGYETTSTGLPIVDGYDYIEQGKRMYCKRFYLSIEEKCGQEWRNIWNGYFTVWDCEWDEDNFVIQTKAMPNDGYDCLLQKWDVKHNLMEVSNKQDIQAIQLYSWFEVILIDIREEEEQDCTDFEADFPNICEYGWVCSRGYKKGTKWWHVHIYVRECSTRQINSSFSQDPSTGLWCRPYNTSNSPRTIACGSSFNISNPYPGNPQWEQFFNINQLNDNFWINTGGYNYYDDGTIRSNIALDDATLFFIGKLQCQKVNSFTSHLLNDATNYVTGENPNPLRTVYVNQKSNIVRFFASSPANKLEISMKKWLEYMKFMFQAFIYLENGRIYLEHISNFQKVTGLDLTTYEDGKYIAGKKKYEYDRANMTTREEWEIGDDKNNFIEYPTRCTNPEVVKKYSESQIFTDIQGMIGNEDAGLEGVVFIHKNATTNEVENQNEYLKIKQLVFNYYKEKRPFVSGAWKRTEPFEANSVQLYKEQDKITYKVECFNFDPLEKIKTQLGDGEVKSAEYSFLERTIDIKLLHNE